MTPDTVARLMAAPLARLRQAIARGVLRLVNDAQGLQVVQVTLLAKQTRDAVEVAGHFGFCSNAPAGADVVIVAPSGSTDRAVAVSIEHRDYRLRNLLPGEAAVHNQWQDRVVFQADGTILVVARGTVRIQAPLVEVMGDLRVTGDVVAGNISLKSHRHGGVRAGTDTSGVPQ
jgi:phage baseplate assembly protein V